MRKPLRERARTQGAARERENVPRATRETKREKYGVASSAKNTRGARRYDTCTGGHEVLHRERVEA